MFDVRIWFIVCYWGCAHSKTVNDVLDYFLQSIYSVSLEIASRHVLHSSQTVK